MLPDIFNKKKLRVLDTGRIWTYTCAYTKSQIPYYIAPREMQELHPTVYMDEVIFLPITNQLFDTRKFHHFVGYRFVFGSHGTTEINERTRLDLGFEACRLGYYIDDGIGNDIMVDFMGDSLFPTAIVNVEGPSESIQESVNNIIENVIDKYTLWYIDRRI